ncbi:MAG: ribonuclease H-like YkuK family protein [Minisyncoccia bacterium]
MQDETFNTVSGLKLTISDVVKEINKFINSDINRKYNIIVGTDSGLEEDKQADFVTAIVIHRVGNGGKYFWRRIKIGKFYTLRDRIVEEVMLSLDAAQKLLLALKQEKIPFNWTFEIHVDVGANGDTRNLIQEVVGMVRANQFEIKTKPNSYAASKVADRYC